MYMGYALVVVMGGGVERWGGMRWCRGCGGGGGCGGGDMVCVWVVVVVVVVRDAKWRLELNLRTNRPAMPRQSGIYLEPKWLRCP